MRRLGRELGVEAMSLYGYIDNKQDLLDGVVERVYREIPATSRSSGPWQERVCDAALRLREVLLRHPNTVTLIATRPILSQGNVAVVEAVLADLRRHGLDLVRASQVVTVIVAYTMGHVAGEVGHYRLGPDDELAEFRQRLDPERFSNVADCCALGPLDRDASFALGLGFVVAGVERMMESVLHPL